MQDKIKARIEMLKAEMEKVQRQFIEDANKQLRLTLAPFEVAINQLEAVLQEMEHEDQADSGSVEVGHEG